MTEEQREFYGINAISHEENIRSLGLPCSMAVARRYQSLVEKKYLAGLNAEEVAEMDRLGREIDRPYEPFYTPIIETLAARLHALMSAHADHCRRAHYEGDGVPCRCDTE